MLNKVIDQIKEDFGKFFFMDINYFMYVIVFVVIELLGMKIK